MRSIKTRGGLTRGRGMLESVRHLWVLSLSHCAGVHDAMMDVSGLTVKTSEQHTDASESRRKRDLEDFTRFKNWLKERNPFTITNTNLQSLSAGWVSITGKDKVNCDEAESIGNAIHQTLDGATLATASIKRKDHLRPLPSLGSVVKIDDQPEYVDPSILFTRVTAVAQCEEDVEKYL